MFLLQRPHSLDFAKDILVGYHFICSRIFVFSLHLQLDLQTWFISGPPHLFFFCTPYYIEIVFIMREINIIFFFFDFLVISVPSNMIVQYHHFIIYLKNRFYSNSYVFVSPKLQRKAMVNCMYIFYRVRLRPHPTPLRFIQKANPCLLSAVSTKLLPSSSIPCFSLSCMDSVRLSINL